MQVTQGHLPERQIEVGWPRKVITLKAEDFTYVPTLGAIHKWIWDIATAYTWHDGWLCPFHTSIDQRNMRCVAGNRGIRSCPGIGLAADDYISYLSPRRQRQCRGWVVCYSWASRLGNAYWDYVLAHQEEHIARPDSDARWIAIEILRNIRQMTGWNDWRRELQLRKEFPRHKRPWLKRLQPGNIGAR